jgi:hypothetical protein
VFFSPTRFWSSAPMIYLLLVFTNKVLEQRVYDLLLVGVLFTNKVLEQRAYDLLLVGVLFTNKVLEQRVYDEKVYSLLVFFSPTRF